MSTLETLIRLSQNRTEERQRLLKSALDAEAETQGRLDALAASVVAEKTAALADPMMAAGLPLYLARAKAEREALEIELQQRSQAAAAARDALAEAFEEQKKYEISKDRRDARLTAEQGRKEQAFLDEIALRKRGG
jgi:flagellar FliJ protein